tara:strand:+ start:1583 stop:1759 length:177 start_codon:yes stop_codon:yes gene_type:complete
MSKKLSISEIQTKINIIENDYPNYHVDLDRDKYHPYDRNNLVRYYKLLNKRKGEKVDE